MTQEYTHLYREELDSDTKWDCRWDIFISAYNDSCRVQHVFDKVQATKKYWIVHEEYGYRPELLTLEDFFLCEASNEVGILDFWEQKIGKEHVDVDNEKMCIDATGFMRPHLMFLLKVLVSKGITKFDVLYSEPEYYAKKERTTFSGSHVECVRQVLGYEGVASSGNARDVLIIGAGYETHLISEVAENKDQAKKVVLLGLPSLRPDMYHQNAWKAWQAEDAIDTEVSERHFVPASDPFATATILSELVELERKRGDVRQIYLAPLSTKAQAVGFALCHLNEYQNSNVSIIYPYTRDYERETAMGVSRVWRHTLEL